MLKLFRYASWGTTAGSLVVIGALAFGEVAAPPDGSEAIERAGSADERFPGLQLHQLREVEFAIHDEEFRLLTRRQQHDQLLDWLFFTAMQEASLSVDEFNEATFDRPVLRSGYVSALGYLEHGHTRSAVVGDGEIIALLPVASDSQRVLDLWKIADDHRNALAAVPARIIPVEYTIDAELAMGTLRRLDAVDGASLFEPQAGYISRTIRSLDDLRHFMATGADLTFASLDANGLTIAGRTLGEPRNARIGLEDVAALWQADRDLQIRLADFERTWQAKLDALNAAWRSSGYTGGGRLPGLDPSIWKLIPGLRPAPTVRRRGEYSPPVTVSSQAEYDREFALLQRAYAEARGIAGVSDGTGFSLDPAYDYQSLAEDFDEIFPVVLLAVQGTSSLTESDAYAATQGLAAEDLGAYFRLTRLLQSSDGFHDQYLGALLEGLLRQYEFQAARYDGDLAGTEVGMVLYYTDLLAKLWALDYMRSTPDGHIEDFPAMTRPSISLIYRAELDSLTSTRLWFGHRDEGFQVGADESDLFFARTATRVYAASADPLLPGIEAPANAHSTAFLGWWNDHYEEVAHYEPQYKRLNQIMKWSLLIGWLNDHGRTDALQFLTPVQVDRSRWFPAWARTHPSLRFTSWAGVRFHPRGYKGTHTEALPRLASQPYELFGAQRVLSGGVSLARKSLFTDRPSISTSIGKRVRRPRVDYAKTWSGESIELLDGTRYSLASLAPDRASVRATGAASTRLRAATAEMRSESIERVASRVTRNQLGLDVVAEQGNVGTLGIRSTRNGFRVGWQGREVARGQAVARRISRSADPAASLARDPDVAAAFHLDGQTGYILRLRDSDRWLHVEREPAGRVLLDETWHARVADVGGRRGLRLRWLEETNVRDVLAERDLHLVQSAGDDALTLRVSRASTVAPGGRPVAIASPHGEVQATFEPATGVLHIKYADLPPALHDQPAELAALLRPADLRGLREVAAGTPGMPPRYAPLQARPPTTSLLADVRNGRFPELARDLFADPATFERRIATDLAERLRFADDLIAQGDHAAARDVLGRAAELHGAQPDILLRQGLAELARGRPDRAASAVEALGGRPLRDRVAFFDEVNARYGRRPATAADRRNTETLVRFADWRDARARRPVPGERVELAADGEGLSIRLRIEGEVKGEPVVDPGSIRPERSAVYVQDRPGLNNLDWSAGLEPSLQQVVSADLGTIVRLPRGDIAGFSPAEIVIEPSGTRLRLVNPGRSTSQFYRASRTTPRGSDDEECAPAQWHDCEGVYLVLARDAPR